MLKSNRKCVRDVVREHLLSEFEGMAYSFPDCDTSSVKSILLCAYESMIAHTNGDYRLKKSDVYNIELFRSWFSGCAVETTYEIVSNINKWLEVTQEEAEKYSTDKTVDLYYKLLYREWEWLCQHHKLAQPFMVYDRMRRFFRCKTDEFFYEGLERTL